jgi:hypothetical protein
MRVRRLLFCLALTAVCATGWIRLATSLEAAPGGQPCGGITGAPCPEGFVCKDVPGDGCNPAQGGADCPGVCRRAH